MIADCQSLFSDLIEAYGLLPDYQKAYVRLNQVFYRSVQMRIAQAKVSFSGIFAKVDYLLKEHKAPRHLAMSVNDTRVRLRRRAELTAKDLKKNFPDDLKSIALFVALIFDADVPVAVTKLFRKSQFQINNSEQRGNTGPTPATGAHKPQKIEYLRAVVDSIDDVYITCHVDFPKEIQGQGHLMQSHDIQVAGTTTLRVSYATENKAFPGDWTYLRAMLVPSMQINLVRPCIHGDVAYPELIIVDPDQLINVSTVAGCFTNYAESHLVELIKRIKPMEMTEAILLGNFAGQLLDEAIHQSQNTYAESITSFFKEHALSMITSDIGEKFHQQAKEQKGNIDAAINTALPWTLSRFDSKSGIVEPSFFSEMLGLQGRMDFLQLDYKVLIEQKSGKSNYTYDFVKPRAKKEHYVQLLLYMLIIRYNFHEEYEVNDKELHAFLLYSKYKEGLVGMGFSPDLVFTAIKIRNALAWANIQYTTPHGIRELERLTPEKINKFNTADALWTRYQSVDIANLLAPIHKASELERDYYFRFLNFLATEHMMAKVGTPDRDCSGFASTWLDAIDDKRSAGNIYDALELVSEMDVSGTNMAEDSTSSGEGKILEVTLRFSETGENDMSNFRKGDIVILYPYKPGHEPDARRTMVHRCTISDISDDTITLTLRAPQTDGRIFRHETGKLWAIEHDFMESSFSSLYRGMHAFLSAPQSRRDLLLMQRRPQIDMSVRLNGDYGDFNDLMLRVKRARDLFIIIGPPGTGKTSFGLLNTLKEELTDRASAVALISYTNRAVDEICSKLHAEGIDFIRIGSAATCERQYKPYLISEKIGAISKLADIKRLVADNRVFVGTSTAFNSHSQIFSLRSFSLAIIDEASQILEPHLIGLLSAASGSRPAISKVVLIGDHKQLPAVVQQPKYMSEVTEPSLRAIGLVDCRLSLFERLLSVYGDDPSVTYMLTRQGRMHPDIAAYANMAFYDGMLKAVPLAHQLPDASSLDSSMPSRVAFVSIDAPQTSPSDKVNIPEAEFIAAFVADLYERNHDTFNSQTVGVIVPYRNQIAAVRSCIDAFKIPALKEVTIDTVERYQGSQRDVIIYGFTVQRRYQLDFLTENRFVDNRGMLIDRKLNVAMTRAKQYLLLVGNPKLLGDDPLFAPLIENYQIATPPISHKPKGVNLLKTKSKSPLDNN